MSEESQNESKVNPRLRSCRMCGKEISPYSPFCRNCGHPQGSTLAVWLLAAFLALLIAVYLAVTIICMCNVQKLRVYDEPIPSVAPENIRKTPVPQQHVPE